MVVGAFAGSLVESSMGGLDSARGASTRGEFGGLRVEWQRGRRALGIRAVPPAIVLDSRTGNNVELLEGVVHCCNAANTTQVSQTPGTE